MYPNPANIRKHAIKVSLNDQEFALIQAKANYTGEQPAVLVRKLMERGMASFAHEEDSSSHHSPMRGAHASYSMA